MIFLHQGENGQDWQGIQN